jgi:3-hydroxyacyl-CoA dehydrogenase
VPRNIRIDEADLPIGPSRQFGSRISSPELADGSEIPRVRSVGVVGAGLMGVAIAAEALRRGIPAVLVDSSPDMLASVRQRILGVLGESFVESYDRLARVGAERDLAGCDLVIESIVERAAEKKALYRRIEPGLSATAILASNTSTIPIERLAAGLAFPERFCGLHFLHPVRRRPMVEVVRGPRTDPAAMAVASAFARQIGKLPIEIADGPGFLVNRLLLPYLNEGLELLLEGVEFRAVDDVALNFGMAMGPLRMLDEIGLETALRAGLVLYEAFPERIAASPLLVAMIKAGRLGRRCGRGFFRYAPGDDGDSVGPDAEALAIVKRWRRAPVPSTRRSIADRLFVPMLLEATRVLEEGKAASARDVDLAAILGLGFPAARGGLLRWAARLGPQRVLARLRSIASLGPRAAPTPLLLAWARRRARFYPPSAATLDHSIAERQIADGLRS